MRNKKSPAVLLVLVMALVLCSGCSSKETQQITGYKQVAELATLECTYHNVAEIYNDGTDYLFGILNVGYKKAWFEYDGTVSIGIDADRVEILPPDENDIVVINVPKAKVVGTPQIVEDSFSTIVIDAGIFQEITAAEQAEAVATAQAQMAEDASNNQELLDQAQTQAEALLEGYVKNLGEMTGTTYTVVFNELDD